MWIVACAAIVLVIAYIIAETLGEMSFTVRAWSASRPPPPRGVTTSDDVVYLDDEAARTRAAVGAVDVTASAVRSLDRSIRAKYARYNHALASHVESRGIDPELDESRRKALSAAQMRLHAS